MAKYNLKTGDRVIITEKGGDHCKMCTIIEASTTNKELPVRIRLVNPHDHFYIGDLCSTAVEKWISRTSLKLYTGKD